MHAYDVSRRRPPQSIPSARPAQDSPAARSATPIYDALYAEWVKSFRTLPGDRSGEEGLGRVSFGIGPERGGAGRHDGRTGLTGLTGLGPGAGPYGAYSVGAAGARHRAQPSPWQRVGQLTRGDQHAGSGPEAHGAEPSGPDGGPGGQGIAHPRAIADPQGIAHPQGIADVQGPAGAPGVAHTNGTGGRAGVTDATNVNGTTGTTGTTGPGTAPGTGHPGTTRAGAVWQPVVGRHAAGLQRMLPALPPGAGPHPAN